MDRTWMKEQREASEKKKQRTLLMARRKQEAALQVEIETQEEWEEMLGKEGLTVVDVYSEWCGPCKAITTILRRVKNELSDDLLKFAMGGVLVAVVRGANCPVVIRTIHEQLANEHKVLDGVAERTEIFDLVVGSSPVMQSAAVRSTDDTEEISKEMTLAIIKPDAVRNGKVDEILKQLADAGIEVVQQDVRSLTDEEAREFYSHLADESYFEEYIKFMTSGPSHVLVLTQTGENVIKHFRDLLGPPSVEQAKEDAPQSLRAQYGSGNFMNALHGSDSPETSAREMAFFFPNFNAKAISSKKTHKQTLQRTLALIRPDALRMHRDEIIAKIKEAGFTIALQKEVLLTSEQAADFYKEHKGQEYFDELVTRMSSGPLLALGLAREDAVSKWREALGPKEVPVAHEQAPDSLRSQFSSVDTTINPLHGSENPEIANKELEYFFPVQKTLAVIKPDAIGTKDEIISKIHEAGFKIAARKETHLSREMAEQLYADQKDKDYFEDLVDHMTTGQTYFMVLTREDAVSGWREILGPTDPSIAKQENPETLRALYGTDIKQNAVHGSSSVEHATRAIYEIFDDTDFLQGTTDEQIVKDSKEAVKSETVVENAEQVIEGKKEEKSEPAPDSGGGAGEIATEERAETPAKLQSAVEQEQAKTEDGEDAKSSPPLLEDQTKSPELPEQEQTESTVPEEQIQAESTVPEEQIQAESTVPTEQDQAKSPSPSGKNEAPSAEANKEGAQSPVASEKEQTPANDGQPATDAEHPPEPSLEQVQE